MTAKLDSLVAARVMKMIPCRGGLFNEPCYWTDSNGSVWLHNGIVPFSPSTSMNDAWEVVEKMRKDGWAYDADDITGGTEQHTFRLGKRLDGGVSREWGDTWVCSESAATLQLAICLAALRAVGVTEGEIQKAMTP